MTWPNTRTSAWERFIDGSRRRKNSFVWFVEHLCELTATDRGLRQMVYSTAYGGHGVECARDRLTPPISKLVERARNDGHLRPGVEHTDMPIIGLLAGTVSEWAGHVQPELWRRYVALLLDGMCARKGQRRLDVDALSEDQMDAAMRGWDPAGVASSKAGARDI
jgi:hypothetical protein